MTMRQVPLGILLRRKNMHMHKRYLTSLGLFLSLTLLVGVFLVVPQVTQARAPYTPISVTQPSECTTLASLAEYNGTQTCVMLVSMHQNISHGIQVHVAYSAVWCYVTCDKPSSSVSGIALTMPEGNTLYSTYSQVPILLIAPGDVHGVLTITFTITGPSNSVKEQLVVSNSEG